MRDIRTCPACFKKMTPIFIEEEEIGITDGFPYKTGRYRKACSHLECKHCGYIAHTGIEALNGPWIDPRVVERK